jgi:hypothetical protein
VGRHVSPMENRNIYNILVRKDLGVCGNMILEETFKKQDRKMQTGFICFGARTSTLVNTVLKFHIP